MTLRTLLALVGLLTVQTVHAGELWDSLSNPTIGVTLKHPPGLGLKVTKVAFGPVVGKCADQVADALVSDFVSNGLEVIDRAHLDTVLKEHDFSFSGYVDQTSAAAIGKILGPSALIFVKTQRCDTAQERLRDKESRYDPETKQNYTVPVYLARTRSFVKASVQTVDLATGRIFSARQLEYSPERINKAYDGFPEFPSDYDVLDLAIRQAVREVHNMFLPWTEQVDLIFYNNKTCNLKQAFESLRSNDFASALQISEQNLAECTGEKIKPKDRGRALYNVGMARMLQGDYDRAIETFGEAQKLNPGNVVSKAMADCQRSKELLVAMQRVEEKAALDVEQRQADAQHAEQKREAESLSNAEIIDLKQKGVSETIILKKIKTSKCKFDTSSDGLVALTAAGIPDSIQEAMLEAMEPGQQ